MQSPAALFSALFFAGAVGLALVPDSFWRSTRHDPAQQELTELLRADTQSAQVPSDSGVPSRLQPQRLTAGALESGIDRVVQLASQGAVAEGALPDEQVGNSRVRMTYDTEWVGRQLDELPADPRDEFAIEAFGRSREGIWLSRLTKAHRDSAALGGTARFQLQAKQALVRRPEETTAILERAAQSLSEPGVPGAQESLEWIAQLRKELGLEKVPGEVQESVEAVQTSESGESTAEQSAPSVEGASETSMEGANATSNGN